MYKSVLAAIIASAAVLAGSSANATSIPFDGLAIDGNDAVLQPELFANAGELQNWKVVTPELLVGNAGQGGVILRVNETPTVGVSRNRPGLTTGPVQVPEPGTLLLLLSGLVATGYMWRQRRVSQTRA